MHPARPKSWPAKHRFCRSCNAAGVEPGKASHRLYHAAHEALRRARKSLAAAKETEREGHVSWTARRYLVALADLHEAMLARDAARVWRQLERQHDPGTLRAKVERLLADQSAAAQVSP